MRALLRRVGRALLHLGEPPAPKVLTNRDQLLRVDARTEADGCAAFVEGEPAAGDVSADCWSDGHYLCRQCSRLDPRRWYEMRHGEWPPDDWTPQARGATS